ncbi:unnamed protein product [Vicia faba]|uniref:Uncharacterized protein n=1 Tax=Vicia faba TaxID=3906 RepID=A0AAV0Z727_VICFA|nr:unnamed protein product [Vicia faba]
MLRRGLLSYLRSFFASSSVSSFRLPAPWCHHRRSPILTLSSNSFDPVSLSPPLSISTTVANNVSISHHHVKLLLHKRLQKFVAKRDEGFVVVVAEKDEVFVVVVAEKDEGFVVVVIEKDEGFVVVVAEKEGYKDGGY